jgi:hypothetical protein
MRFEIVLKPEVRISVVCSVAPSTFAAIKTDSTIFCSEDGGNRFLRNVGVMY